MSTSTRPPFFYPSRPHYVTGAARPQRTPFHYQGVNYRLLFFVDKGKALFTNGFTKKTDKVPEGEIDTAQKIKEEYYKTKR